jgi:hypothetical protein
MIELNKPIKLNDNQELIIYADGIQLLTKSTSRSFYLIKQTIFYKDFYEKTEVRKIVNYDKIFYYDENGKEHLLIEEQNHKEEFVINISYRTEKEDYTFIDIVISNIELAFEVVKTINMTMDK